MDKTVQTENVNADGSSRQEMKRLEPKSTQIDQLRNRMRSFGIVVLCFLAGFGGAWTYLDSGLVRRTDEKNTQIQRVMAEGEIVTDIAKQVSPSVVSIIVASRVNQDIFFGGTYQEGAGTGIVVSKDGYILTNKHVIPTGTSKVRVVMHDGTTYNDVNVVGRDPINDIAFLKVNGSKDMTPAKIGDSSKLVVGNKVVAIGNALGEFQATVTQGIVSGVNRSVTAGSESDGSSENLSNLIQTDAAINPGNSGGPLVNISGEVIGINTAVSQGAEGIGFAIPINEAKGLIAGVVKRGKVERGYLGVRYIMLNDEIAKHYNLNRASGAYVYGSRGNDAVMAGSPAQKAGLQDGDIITKIDNVELGERASLVSLLSQHNPGDSVSITFVRDNKEQTVTVKLETYN